MKRYLIYRGFEDIVFIRTDTGRTSKVSVKLENARHAIHTYTFRNIPADTFVSQYISWANLNCCNGWKYDESYLLTAVQEGKKLCAGIVIRDDGKHRAYLEVLHDDYPHFCQPVSHNGTFHHVDVTRKGCINDYIDMDAVRETYLALETKLLNFDIINGYTEKPMIHLLDGTIVFDYANPKTREEFVVTGLLLGYPLESTAAII